MAFNYKFNYRWFVEEAALALALRGDRWRAWVVTLLRPMRYLNEYAIASRNEAVTILTTSGQFIYLKKLLNDEFDPNQRRIEVVNDATTPGQFKVRIPVLLGLAPPNNPVLDRLNALVKRFTIAGNRHVIEYYI